jgi:aminoglycoside 3-N-acetyltransferase I
VSIRRLTAADREPARQLFALLARVFGEPQRPLSDDYLDRLLGRADFWAMAAFVDGRLVGGLTAYTLALTREEGAEIFIYDVAVDPAVQRRGVGRALIDALLREAAALNINVAFVPADNACHPLAVTP